MYNLVECYQVCTGVYLANGIQNDDGSTLIHFRLFVVLAVKFHDFIDVFRAVA